MAAMPVVSHVAITPAADYVARREPHRQDHLQRLAALRSQGLVVGGGPSPDAKHVDVFYRTDDPAMVRKLVEDDPYYTGGAWTGYQVVEFANFIEPWRLLPPALDGSRHATIVEGQTLDIDMATFVLIEARGTGQMSFGGFFTRGGTLAVMAMQDEKEAASTFVNSGFWSVDTITTRPWLHVL
jgi:uncharacterized protein YciI